MLISPHALKALVHQHVVLRDLLCHALATVLLAGHNVDRVYRKRERPLQSSARAEKSKETGTIASADVFKARALDRYLKPQNEGVDASDRAKGTRN